jgi:hypothetical protein
MFTYFSRVELPTKALEKSLPIIITGEADTLTTLNIKNSERTTAKVFIKNFFMVFPLFIFFIDNTLKTTTITISATTHITILLFFSN